MELVGSALPNFFKANGAILGLLLALLALGSGVQRIVFSHPYVAVGALLFIEFIIVMVLAYLHRDQSTQDHFEGAGDAETVEARQVRFATAQDFHATDRVYLEWFKPSLSVDDGEYCKLLERGEFVRVVEAKHRDGAQHSNMIVGYYSVWPLSAATFEAMAKGHLREREVTSAMILSPSDPLAKVVYVPEICASKRAWAYARRPLVADLARYIGYLLVVNPHLDSVAAWPYTKQGQHYVDRAKMKRIHGGWMRKFYWASRDTILAIPQTHRPFKPKWNIPF